MGNTNLPQFGTADTENSRDTLVGANQLTEAQKEQREPERKQGNVGPSPGRPANAPERIPGQQRDADEAAKERVTEDDEKRARDADVERPVDVVPYNPKNTVETIIGHVNTGHSPSDAT